MDEITLESAKQRLRAEYWRSVCQAAAGVKEEVKDGYDLEESLDSWADSQVTYTSNALQVLQFTENDSAIEVIFGDNPSEWGSNGVHDLYTKIAYWAFREDVRQEYDRLPEEEEETDEEE